MPTDNRRLILANGERLVGKVEKKGTSRPSPLPRSYDEARELVIRQTGEMLRSAANISENRRYPDELFVCFRLHPDMLAKTYEPDSIFVQIPDLKKVGSRNWRPNLDEVAQTEKVKKQKGNASGVQGIGRLLFVKGNEEGYERLIHTLNRSTHVLPAVFQSDIRKIERIDFLSPEEQLQGFEDDWMSGRVEMVLHPSLEGAERQISFFNELFDEINIAKDRARSVFYGDGPGFISALATKESLLKLRGCNPLRTAHPIIFNGVTDLRTLPNIKAPPPPAPSTTRSTIKIGLFDGGIDPNCPHLKGFAEEDAALAIKSKSHPAYTSHGTAVAGAVLYGSLDQYDPSKALPAPPVSVVSIRVFPPTKAGDHELYECIDVIENAVPSRPDISVYNLSFGPRGPILDDSISRFTYALDQLAIQHRVLFFVAVGNDGEDPKLHRIQVPSDVVHGIGVGAYTIRRNGQMRAPYSCKGPGREGAKIKPDFAAFGGCEVSLFHLLSINPGMKITEMGTSYASPVASRLGALTNGLFDRATPLLTRALLTHCAIHPDGKPDHEIGHGFIPDSVEDILNCSSTAVTIAYQGDVLPKNYYQLQIPLPTGLNIPGLIQITWTIAAMCPVEFDHPGDYTACCIEDTFYPNSQIFTFTPKNKKGSPRHLHIVDDRAEIAALGGSWKKSDFPLSRSGNKYPTEHEMRDQEYKWDTIVRRSISARAASLHQPFIVLHAIGRHSVVNRFPYAAVVTISAPKFTADLHNEIVRKYPVLQPIRVKTQAEIRIQI